MKKLILVLLLSVVFVGCTVQDVLDMPVGDVLETVENMETEELEVLNEVLEENNLLINNTLNLTNYDLPEDTIAYYNYHSFVADLIIPKSAILSKYERIKDEYVQEIYFEYDTLETIKARITINKAKDLMEQSLKSAEDNLDAQTGKLTNKYNVEFDYLIYENGDHYLLYLSYDVYFLSVKIDQELTINDLQDVLIFLNNLKL